MTKHTHRSTGAWWRLAAALVLILAISASAKPAHAQTYLFEVQKAVINVFINADGTASIEYLLDLFNNPSASPIDPKIAPLRAVRRFAR